MSMPRNMKERELRDHATCDGCNRKIGHTGVPIFWRLQVDQFGLDVDAIKRQSGMAAMMDGNAFLASVMGPDQDMAKPVMDTVTLTLCQQCAVNDPTPPLMVMVERAEAKADLRKTAGEDEDS